MLCTVFIYMCPPYGHRLLVFIQYLICQYYSEEHTTMCAHNDYYMLRPPSYKKRCCGIIVSPLQVAMSIDL